MSNALLTFAQPNHMSALTNSSRTHILDGKRVAMVTFSPYPADPRPRRAANALLDQGMSVDLICLGDEKTSTREVMGKMQILRLPIRHRRGGKVAYAFEYCAFILISTVIFAFRSLRRPYDLVYVHNMPDILVVTALIPKALGAKVILDLHDPMPELMMTIFNRSQASPSVRIMSWLEKWSIARTDLVITVNIACKRLFALRSCSSEKIGVVMNSPAEEIFRPQISANVNTKDRSSRKQFVIMYHGSLVERNGLDLAVEALARLQNAIPNAELRIYGRTTPFLEQVMKMVAENNLSERVRHLGAKSLEELVHEIEDCDVGIIPNHLNRFTEINTPTRILEYLALGKPVIAPRTRGIQDYFSPESLIFFSPGSSGDLADKIEYTYRHPAEVAATADRGQQIYMAHTWRQEKDTLIGLVSDLMKDPKESTVAAYGAGGQ